MSSFYYSSISTRTPIKAFHTISRYKRSSLKFSMHNLPSFPLQSKPSVTRIAFVGPLIQRARGRDVHIDVLPSITLERILSSECSASYSRQRDMAVPLSWTEQQDVKDKIGVANYRTIQAALRRCSTEGLTPQQAADAVGALLLAYSESGGRPKLQTLWQKFCAAVDDMLADGYTVTEAYSFLTPRARLMQKPYESRAAFFDAHVHGPSGDASGRGLAMQMIYLGGFPELFARCSIGALYLPKMNKQELLVGDLPSLIAEAAQTELLLFPSAPSSSSSSSSSSAPKPPSTRRIGSDGSSEGRAAPPGMPSLASIDAEAAAASGVDAGPGAEGAASSGPASQAELDARRRVMQRFLQFKTFFRRRLLDQYGYFP